MNVYEALNDDYVRNKHEDVEKDLQQYIATAQAAGVQDVRGIISEGNPGEKIVEDIIPQYQPDLLIIGSLDKKGPHPSAFLEVKPLIWQKEPPFLF